jgi:flagellar hook-associated protein 2
VNKKILFLSILIIYSVQFDINPQDSIIPGFTSKFDSASAIKKIMDAKQEKLTKMQKEQDDIKTQKKSWSELKEKTLSLQTKAKKLYNYDSPFDDKISQSSDENAFKATVSRLSEIGEHTVEIKTKAQSHKIASDSLPRTYKIPAGDYSFMVGKDKVDVPFSGGTIDNFIEAINKYGKNVIKASTTYDTVKTQVLIIEGMKTGSENVISFNNEKTKEVFQKMNFFELIPSYDKVFKISQTNLADLSDKKSKTEFASDGSLILYTNKKFKYTLPEKIPYKDRLIMQIDLRLDQISETKSRDLGEPTGPNFPKEGDITIYGIHIEGEPNLVDIPPYEKKQTTQPTIVEDNRFIDIVTNKRTIELDKLDVNNTKKTLDFQMKNIMGPDETIEAVIVKNANTSKYLEASNLRFFDEGSQNGMRFGHELSKAQDMNMIYDGVKVQRSNNVIDDLSKGTTITVYDTTRKEEKLKIDRDYEKIVKNIIDFLGDYNQLLDLVNKKTRFSDDAEAKGEFIGEYGLTTMVMKLRTIMMNSYPTSLGKELSMLSQIGISTNENASKQMDAEKIYKGGILEVNENKFVDQMQKYAQAIKQLFGYDTNGDLAVDSGVGYEIDTLLKLYTSNSTGYYDLKQKMADSQIEQKKKDIDKYKVTMSDEEKKLKEQFFKMEDAAKKLDDANKQINNMNK